MRKSEYPKEAKTLGQKIRKKRMDLGLSLDEIAEKVGVTGGYLSRIESDIQIPSPEIAAGIAKVLEENVRDYFMESIVDLAQKAIEKCPKDSQEDLEGLIADLAIKAFEHHPEKAKKVGRLQQFSELRKKMTK